MGFWDNFVTDRPGPKYLAICEALADAIQRGRLAPGRRLPSHRLLAKRLGVSVGTISRAYEEALERGLITGEVGRGSFVTHHQPQPFAVADGSRVPPASLDLLQNFPVPIPEIEKKAWSDALATLRSGNDLAAMARRSFSEVTHRHQEIGASWIRRSGLDPATVNVFDCPGVQSALCSILAATTSPGDLVVAASLSHPGFKSLASQLGLKTQGLPMDEHGIDPAGFEAVCREDSPRLLYTSPTIHSPTAATMPVEQRREIAAIADRHDVIIVEDEASSFLLPEPPLPVSAFAPRRSFFIGDVWLALSLGLRTTYVLAPEPWREAMGTAVAATSGITMPLVAEIAATWIESGTADRLIEHRRSELEARNEIAEELLGTRRMRADPLGHHVWLELPEPWRSDMFVVRAEQLGVAIGGAECFAFGHGPIPEAVRICIGNAPGRRELRWALEELDALIDDPDSTSPPTV